MSLSQILDCQINEIAELVIAGERVSIDQGELLYKRAPLMLLSKLALHIKHKKSQNKVFYNRNFHIEPTNICVFRCKFCSYRKSMDSSEAWCMNESQILEYAKEKFEKDCAITEVHLVGGVHPHATLDSYCSIIASLRELLPPSVAIKAFSAIEHIYVIEKAGLTYHEGLKRLIESGMDSITGGGAEIFNPSVRKEICADKGDTDQWLALHRAAHELGVKTASTMLYGHIETVHDRLSHIDTLRREQDITGGYNVFIPLKFRNRNNSMSYIEESSLIEDLKTIALSRIMFDNIDHIKAYPPSLGITNTQFALMFGADDIDGTVNDTTKIYSMAGVNNDILTESRLRDIASSASMQAVERDTFYNEI